MNSTATQSWARRYRYEAALTAIVLVGAVLRFADLGSESIWVDEALSIDRAHLGLSQLIDELQASSVHPPLYFVLLRYWGALFGFTEVGLRSLSAVAGVTGIAALYALAKEMYDPKVGLIGAAVLVVSPLHIYYSQEARTYALLFLFAVLSMHAYYLAFISRRNITAIAYYVAVTVSVLHLHFNAMFVVVAQATHFVLFRTRTRRLDEIKRFVAASLLVLLGAVPLAVLTLKQVATARGIVSGLAPRPSLLKLWQNFLVFAGDQLTRQAYRRFPISTALLLVLGATGLLLFRLRAPRASQPQGVVAEHWTKAGLLLLWMASSVLIPFVISRVTTSIFVGRTLIPTLAPLIVLASLGLSRIAPATLRLALVVVLVALALMPLRAQFAVRSKGQWRETAAYVEGRAAHGAAVVFEASYAYRPYAYYQRRTDLDILVADAASPAAIARRLKTEREAWVVLSHHRRRLRRVLTSIEEDFEVERIAPFVGIRLLLFQRL